MYIFYIKEEGRVDIQCNIDEPGGAGLNRAAIKFSHFGVLEVRVEKF